jgi:Fe-S-cluster-containing hydrogenase component 2
MSKSNGMLSLEEIKTCPGWPGDDLVERKRVAILECVEDIPCNPCETICPKGAITVGEPITNLPAIDGEKCDGCGMCIAACPGLAIFVLDKHYTDARSAIAIPYELLPFPERGAKVKALNRRGEYVADAEVIRVVQTKKFDRTAVVTIAVDKKYVNDVRSIKV